MIRDSRPERPGPRSPALRLLVAAVVVLTGPWALEQRAEAGWQGWEQLGGNLTSAPSATSDGPTRLDVFARGSDGHLWHLWWDGTWHPWEDLDPIVVARDVTLPAVPVPITIRKGMTLPLASAPGCTAKQSRHLDCFVRDPDGRLWHKFFRGSGGWSEWELLGGSITTAPAVASRGARSLHVVAGTEGDQWAQVRWDGARWGSWETLGRISLETSQLSLGRSMSSAPTCAVMNDRLHCFVQDEQHHLWHRWQSGESWSVWQDLGGDLRSAPSAVSWGRNRLDVFALDANGGLIHSWWDGRRWSAWESLGGTLVSAPSCTSRGPEMIDCFAVGRDPMSGLHDVLLHRAHVK